MLWGIKEQYITMDIKTSGGNNLDFDSNIAFELLDWVECVKDFQMEFQGLYFG